MKKANSILVAIWTLLAGYLLLLEAGTFPWWDVIWVLLLSTLAYGGLVSLSGLAKARACAGIVLVAFSALIALTIFTGWPLGPMRFCGLEGLKLGGTFPLLPPLLALALLTLAQKSAAQIFSTFERNALAAISSGFFCFTLVNGLIFLSKTRLWWLWNPWGGGGAFMQAMIAFVTLAIAGFFLARIYPEDTGLKLTRWSPEGVVLLCVNALFLTVNILFFAQRL